MKKHPPITTQRAQKFYEGATQFLNPRIRRVPRFDYQNLPDTEQLTYELLTWNNFKNFLTLFENDPHPFVMKEFKTLEQLEMDEKQLVDEIPVKTFEQFLEEEERYR
jgi:hypothetical protein